MVWSSGYTIPKGWKVLAWFRTIHLDPEVYPNPKEFNPSRWDVSELAYIVFIYSRTQTYRLMIKM